MIRLGIILTLSATVLFCGCGGAPRPASAPGGSAPVTSSAPKPRPRSHSAIGNLTRRPLSPESLRLRLPAVSARPALRSTARSMSTVQIISTD